MTVDTTLTSAKAMERIGKALQYDAQLLGEERMHPDLYARLQTDPSRMFTFEYDARSHDYKWTFGARSALARELKKLRGVQRELGLVSKDKGLHEAGISAENAYVDTCIPAFFSEYAMQMQENVGFLRHYPLLEDHEHPMLIGEAIQEGVLNAVEHGSDFGEKGDVRCRFIGGEKGALMLIDDPGSGFELRQLSPEELEQRRSLIEVSYGLDIKPPKSRGMGELLYSWTKKSVIGSEREGDVFRLIVLYPNPSEEEAERHMEELRRRRGF